MARKKICGIYKITSPNGNIYIGQAFNIIGRFSDYLKLRCKSQSRIYNSLLKYGPDNHIFEIIEECSKEKLNEREIYWIAFYKTFNTDHGLNLQEGGANGSPSKETREKIGKAHKGKIVSKETSLKISQSKTGHKMSEESRLNISNGKRGHVFSDEARKALLIRNNGNTYMLGRKHSQETKSKISKGNIGKIMPEECKHKIGNHLKKMIINLENGIYYDSLKDAYESYTFKKDITYSALRAQLGGQNKNYTSLIYA
jgi:group I intron endonuclease